MLIPLLMIVQVLTLLAVVWLAVRKTGGDGGAERLAEMLVRHEARLGGIEAGLRTGLSELNQTIRADLALHRTEAGGHAGAVRDAQVEAGRQLRDEVAKSVGHLSTTLANGLENFRGDHRGAAETLKGAVAGDLANIQQRLTHFFSEASRAQIDARDALHNRLTGLEAASAAHQEKLRGTVGDSLAKLNKDNAAKLEEMRATVDEKLHATLHTRLTESFGQVTDQLNKVHTGLGEMTKLSAGVDDLSRIFTNVKSRGGFAEVQLGMILKQMLAPGQYIENATVKAGSGERVEFAIRLPTSAGEHRLMPIDAKFPREAWERLEAAYESNVPDLIQREGKAFENAIRTEASRICGKYINDPVTTPYAIMFLPTEGLYAEVIRRSELQAEIQRNCHVTIAGPTTLSAILTSFQLGFQMLTLQAKGDEVWKVLSTAKTEFKTFETLMTGMEKQVGTVQNTIQKLGVRTRAINRSLRDVSESSDEAQVIAFEDFAEIAPRLAAVAEED